MNGSVVSTFGLEDKDWSVETGMVEPVQHDASETGYAVARCNYISVSLV